MPTEKLSCNSCGAPLEVPTSANYVTCNHCSMQLTVKRLENVTFTEQLERLEERTDELSEKIDEFNVHSEVAALDRAWEFERKKHLVAGSNGVRRVPTKGGSIGGGVFIAIFGGIWTILAFAMTSDAPDHGAFSIVKIVFPLFGVVFVVGGVVSSVASHTAADRYQKAEARYERRRAELQASEGT